MSSSHGGTMVWKDASPTPLQMRAARRIQYVGDRPAHTTAMHQRPSPTDMSMKGLK